MDTPKFAEMKKSELTILDPDSSPIPVCDQKAWNLAQRLARSNAISMLGSIEGIIINRGEINQTIFRKFITRNERNARMLKGVEIGRYRVKSRLSQGEVEWFDVEKFERSHDIPPQVRARRIATQRITGVDERLRIVATMAGPDWFFADSTNSILVSKNCVYAPEYILALLNSKLFQWRFKITSTNNNVGTNELGTLPVRDIQSDDAADRSSYSLIVSSVKAALRSATTAEASKSERARESAEKALLEAVRIIDDEIAKLYGLTDDDVETVESASIIPQAAPIGEAAWVLPG